MTQQDNRNQHQEDAELWLSAVSHEALSKYDGEKAYQAFLQRKRASGSFRWSRALRWTASVAAGIVLLAGVSFLSFRSGRSTVESAFNQVLVQAPIGSNTVLVLPDGTRVNLNAGSSLRYSQGFGISERALALEGEGFFEVTRNEHLPFRITSPSLAVEVLGTKFNFKDYPEDPEASVFLQEGKVALENLVIPGEKTIMAPGQTAILTKDGGAMRLDDEIGTVASGWNRGELIFEDQTLEEIARILGRSYNAEWTFRDPSLARLRFNGTFSREDQTLQEILDVLSATRRFRYAIHEGTIEIY